MLLDTGHVQFLPEESQLRDVGGCGPGLELERLDEEFVLRDGFRFASHRRHHQLHLYGCLALRVYRVNVGTDLVPLGSCRFNLVSGRGIQRGVKKFFSSFTSKFEVIGRE